jgi:hypothetical protein
MTKRIDVAAIAKDPGQRFAFLREFTGFGADDWAAIRDSVRVLGPRLPGLLDAIYDHLLSFDDTRRIFLGARGEVDPAYIAIRKEHLTDWVLKTVEGNEEGFARWLSEIGRRHTGVAGEPNRVVPPRYMVGLTSFVQTALTATILDALADKPAEARRTAIAWNKMMMIQLEIFLKAMAPAWPHWDEG